MKRLLSLVLAVIMPVVTLIMPVARVQAAVTYEKKDVTACIFAADEQETFTCLFRPDMNLPYINATDYLNTIYYEEFSTVDNSNGTYTISNKNGGFVVDIKNDTVHFDDFENVVYFDLNDFSETKEAEYLEDDDIIFKDVQPSNVSSLIIVTLSGIVIFVNEVQFLNA